ncbi:DBH-like monooxygenase protein 1 [Hyalella azteca]|uniref:DBH-like monooxygenase protein 1 n=1 Tax=Hyalella azteca TaxID=294128 RepID=A0A8B7P1Y4_HYAAZ|nr:DBH-like monooxygenase protein 1 [Hyalella azteca]
MSLFATDPAWHVRLVCLVALFCGASLSLAQDEAGPLLHSVNLDPFGKFVMTWTPREDDILIELQVATRGYVGIGFSPSGLMKGADIILGWVDEAGDAHVSDRYGTGNRTPMMDVSQDVVLVGGGRNASHTIVRFRRPWVTCDDVHDVPLTSDTVRVIYAYDDQIPAPGFLSLPYHDGRGVKSLILKDHVHLTYLGPQDQDALHWDVRAPGVLIPSNFSTLYWCKLYKLPELQQKHHYIGYAPLVSEASAGLVHHALLYECHLSPSALLDAWVQELGAQCYTPNMPLSWRACNTPLVSWAVGSQGMMLPSHVGTPLGETYKGSTYYMLEIHYNNPQKVPNVRDSSGLRIFYTPKLRKYDTGTLVIGHGVDPTQVIPPRRPSWLSLGHCSAQCTAQSVPKDGVRILAGAFHAHTIASRMALHHIRDGRQLPTYLQDQLYDFNFQQERVMSQEQTLLPGDHLIVSCTYDSSGRSQPTFGGFGAGDEMCLAYLTYYPRLPLSDCYSKPKLDDVLGALGVQEIYDAEEFKKDPFGEPFSVDMIDRAQEASLAKIMKESASAGSPSMDLSMSWYLHRMKIKLPYRLQNQSVLELLYDESFWQDALRVQALQKVYAEGDFLSDCLNSGRQPVSQVPTEDTFPRYKVFVPREDACISNEIDFTRNIRVAGHGNLAMQKNGGAANFLPTYIFTITFLQISLASLTCLVERALKIV